MSLTIKHHFTLLFKSDNFPTIQNARPSDRKEPSKHGRNSSLTNVVHRIRHAHSLLRPLLSRGTSSAAAQQDAGDGINVEHEVLVRSSQRRTEADRTHSQGLFRDGDDELQRRQCYQLSRLRMYSTLQV